jgi:hypothetical protein
VRYVLPDGTEHIKNTIKGIPKRAIEAKPNFQRDVFKLFKDILKVQNDPQMVVTLALRHNSKRYTTWAEAEEGSEAKVDAFQAMYRDVYKHALYAEDATFCFEQWVRTYIRPTSKETAKGLGMFNIHVKKGENQSSRSIGKTIYRGRRPLSGPKFEQLFKPAVPVSSNYTSEMVEDVSLREYLATELAVSSVNIPPMDELMVMYKACTDTKDFRELSTYLSEPWEDYAEETQLDSLTQYWEDQQVGIDIRLSLETKNTTQRFPSMALRPVTVQPPPLPPVRAAVWRHSECEGFHRPGIDCGNCNLLARGSGKAAAPNKRATL